MKQYAMILAGVACLAFLGIRSVLNSPEPEEEAAPPIEEMAPPPEPKPVPVVEEPIKLKLSPEAMTRVRNATRDTETDIRWEATRFLVKIQDESAGEKLFDMLHRDLDPVNRRRVIGLLAEYNEPEVTRSLIRALRDTDNSVRIAVLSALGAIGDYSAAKPIGRMVHDSDERVRLKAIETLDALDTRRDAAIEAAKLKHEEEMRQYERQIEERRRMEAPAQAAQQK